MNNIVSDNQESPKTNCSLGGITPSLNLVHPLKKGQKPQISSVPGVSPKERNRYRVMLGAQILGMHLTIDEALELAAKGGEQ
jgi:hypothetical protein